MGLHDLFKKIEGIATIGDVLDLVFGPTTTPQEEPVQRIEQREKPDPKTWRPGLTMDDRVLTGPAREHGMAIGGTAARIYLLHGLEKYEKLGRNEAKLLLRHSHDLDLAATDPLGGTERDPFSRYIEELGYKPRSAGTRRVWKKGPRIVDYFGYDSIIGTSGLSPRDIIETYEARGKKGYDEIEAYGKRFRVMPLEALLATKLRVKDHKGRISPRQKDYSDVANLVAMYEDQIDEEVFAELVRKGHGGYDPVEALETLKEKVLGEDLPRLLYTREEIVGAIDRLKQRIQKEYTTRNEWIPVTLMDFCAARGCEFCYSKHGGLPGMRVEYRENDGYGALVGSGIVGIVKRVVLELPYT